MLYASQCTGRKYRLCHKHGPLSPQKLRFLKKITFHLMILSLFGFTQDNMLYYIWPGVTVQGRYRLLHGIITCTHSLLSDCIVWTGDKSEETTLLTRQTKISTWKIKLNESNFPGRSSHICIYVTV